jgi:flagellar biogenesis protein FliO
MKKAVFLILLFFTSPVLAGNVTSELTPNSLVFTISFNGGYSNLGYSETPSEYILDFETIEGMSFIEDSVPLWKLPMASTRLVSQGIKHQLIFSFTGTVIKPNVTTQDKTLRLDFPLPPEASAANPADAPPIGWGAYFQMFIGLVTVVIFILLCYGVMKMFFKTNISSDIPGSGRLLGKIDLSLKKTVYFYELGESIYILGGTDHAINLIDKLTDPAEINIIKSGFAKRKNFSVYLKFFRRGAELKDEIKDSGAILEDKLSKLQKK